MALLKTKNDPYGNGGIEYWKIIETNINWLEHRAQVTVGGYVNQAARDADKKVIEVQRFNYIANNRFPAQTVEKKLYKIGVSINIE